MVKTLSSHLYVCWNRCALKNSAFSKWKSWSMLSICLYHKFRVSYLYSPAHLFSSTHKTMRKYRKLERNMKISFKKSVPENKEKHQSMFARAQSDKSDRSLSFSPFLVLQRTGKKREKEKGNEKKRKNKTRREEKRSEKKGTEERHWTKICIRLPRDLASELSELRTIKWLFLHFFKTTWIASNSVPMLFFPWFPPIWDQWNIKTNSQTDYKEG